MVCIPTTTKYITQILRILITGTQSDFEVVNILTICLCGSNCAKYVSNLRRDGLQ